MSEHTPPIRGRKGLSKSERFNILRRDGHRCTYCGASSSLTELHVDHVVPVCEGGSNDPDNLVTACRDCNLGKSGKSLVPLDVQLEAEEIADCWRHDLAGLAEQHRWEAEYRERFAGEYDDGRRARAPLPLAVLEERVPVIAEALRAGALPFELHRLMQQCLLAFRDQSEQEVWHRFTRLVAAMAEVREWNQ